jgi:general secretion pathway protein E
MKEVIDTPLMSASDVEQKLAVMLVDQKHLNDDELALAITTGESMQLPLLAALSRLGLCGDETIYSVLADVYGVSLIRQIADCPQSVDLIETAQELKLSIDWCISQSIFVKSYKSRLAIYTDNPFNQFALDVVDSVKPTTDSLLHIVTPAMAAAMKDDIDRERAVNELFGKANVDIAALAEEAPVINLVNSIIERAIQTEASDIHIENGTKNLTVRFRVDGKMIEFMQQPATRFAAIASRIKLMAQLDIAERRLPQDGRFSTRASKKAFDVRVSTAPDVHGESIVMRLLPKQRESLNLGGLGFEPDHLALIREWGSLSNGIVLVTGPTGSGKSTTLYGLLEDIKTGEEKIVTVEDPVEYQVEGITQVQARPDIGYTFARALRTFLRQDPDIIMVGEIRDKETADIAVQSSLTGHLVLSTLHTNDACSVFPRLTDIGVAPYLVAATIQGVQAQRLVRKLCPDCSEPAEAPSFIATQFEHANWRKPVGCPSCHGRGYRGRIGVYELVPVTAEIRRLITAESDVGKIREAVRSANFRSLMDDGLLKASRGETSVDEVLRVCSLEEDAET